MIVSIAYTPLQHRARAALATMHQITLHNASAALHQHPRSPLWFDQNLVCRVRRSRTGFQAWQCNCEEIFLCFFFSPFIQFLAPLMAVFNTCLCDIKTVGPVSLVHSSSTEPAGQTLPWSSRKLG